MTETSTQSICIWVDADACPATIKDIIFRTSKRLEVPVVLVANQSMQIPRTKLVRLLLVPHGADAADNKIVESINAGDVVITGDIPLAARVVEKSAIAIGTRGERYDDNSVHERLASRNLMEQFRSAGVETSGPKPHTPKDVQAFANEIDRTLTKLMRKRQTGES